MTDDLNRCVSEALRTSSAATDDCPSLFLRVAAGVARRRRRHRTTAGAVVAVAVGAVLAVPAMAQVTAGHTTISAEAPIGTVVDSCAGDTVLPPNSFLRRSEALDGRTCSSAEPVQPTTARWVHPARWYGLEQP